MNKVLDGRRSTVLAGNEIAVFDADERAWWISLIESNGQQAHSRYCRDDRCWYIKGGVDMRGKVK